MPACLARQPIFDSKLKVYGYELLYRSSEGNRKYDCADPDRASSETILLSLDIGSGKLTGNRMAFINFTEKLLLDEVATILPPNKLVVEILESVRPGKGIVKACRNLKKQGYLLCLDDFEYAEDKKCLLDMADIVKLDFQKLGSPEGVYNEIEKIKNAGIRGTEKRHGPKLLAEKLETRDDYRRAREMGFSYFQGFFFSRPETLKRKSLNPLRVNQLRMIRETMNPMADYQKLAAAVCNDPVLSYRILRIVNSAYYSLRYEVNNMRQALAILGIENIKKYVTLLTLEDMADEKPEELFVMSLVRGRFLEDLAPKVGLSKSSEDLFMTGLFSLMDTMAGMTMKEVVELTQLGENISAPLLTNQGRNAELLDIIRNYERGHWDEASAIAERYDISPNEMLRLYINAIEWADAMF